MARIWLGVVALVLLALPATALADSAQPFTASGNICLAELPQFVVATPQPTGVQVTALGEKLAGIISASSGWDDLEEAAVHITITRETSFFDFTTLTFSGKINGILKVTTADDVLVGTFRGTVSGVFLNPEDILGSIVESTAQVKWRVSSEDVKASGQANATFAPTELGYCGPLSLAGTVWES